MHGVRFVKNEKIISCNNNSPVGVNNSHLSEVNIIFTQVGKLKFGNVLLHEGGGGGGGRR